MSVSDEEELKKLCELCSKFLDQKLTDEDLRQIILSAPTLLESAAKILMERNPSEENLRFIIDHTEYRTKFTAAGKLLNILLNRHSPPDPKDLQILEEIGNDPQYYHPRVRHFVKDVKTPQ